MNLNLLNKTTLLSLHPRSSVAEVEKAYRDAGLMSDWGYAKDYEFIACFKSINTVEKLLKFVQELNEDRLRYELKHQRYWKYKNNYISSDDYIVCQKTWGITNWLKDKNIWDAESLARILAYHRRVCCSCHKLGSYELSFYR